MLSINNFFGIDLENMPNHISIYKGSSYNTSGAKVRDYFHAINPDCENHYFHSLVVKVIGDSATNFIFDPIPYNHDNAVDIAFVIERDLFNNGNLNYMDYLTKEGNKLSGIYSRIEWKIDKATIELSRDDSEMSLTVWSHFYHEIDSSKGNDIIPNDAHVAEDGIIEYNFGSDFYPQGCEVLQNDKDYVKPLPIDDFIFRTIKIRVSATDERLNEAKHILEELRYGNEQTFVGARLNGAFVFVNSDNRIVFPMTELEDRKNTASGSLVGATVKGFDCDKLDTYIGFTFQVMTSKEKKDKNIINLPINELYGYRAAPEYLNELIEQFQPKNIIKLLNEDENKAVSQSNNKVARTKIISISFNEYDLSSSKLEYLKNCADDENIEFKLSLKIDKRKREYIAVESVNSDVPLSTEIKNECFIEDFKKHEQSMKEGKSTEKCYGVLFHYQDANSEFSTSQRIFFHVKIFMPWTIYKEIPNVPEKPQETPNLETAFEGEQKYVAKLVGFKFCLNEDELEEVDRYLDDFNNVILLKPEYDNPFDSNAIAAFMDNGKKIAYVAKENAQILRPLLNECKELKAIPDRFDFTTATLRMSLPCNKSLEMESLFSKYKPIEVYKAHYLNVYWGGNETLTERRIFNSNEQTINFQYLLSLPIAQQNYLAVEWKDNMTMISVENPTNLGLKMSVHLDLSIYGTNLADIDLSDIALLDKIEDESKKTALFIRLKREGYISTPEEFLKEHCVDASETLKKRIQDEYKF